MVKNNLINAKRVKEYLNEQGAKAISPEVIDILNDIVRELSDKALSRSQANNRNTIMKRDF